MAGAGAQLSPWAESVAVALAVLVLRVAQQQLRKLVVVAVPARHGGTVAPVALVEPSELAQLARLMGQAVAGVAARLPRRSAVVTAAMATALCNGLADDYHQSIASFYI